MAEQTKVKRPRIQSHRVIRVLTDSDGVAYSADNNPKRNGSKAAERFTLYAHGMTVADAREAGVFSGDIQFDLEKGFISLQAEEVAA